MKSLMGSVMIGSFDNKSLIFDNKSFDFDNKLRIFDNNPAPIHYNR
jgi:hypothetical protein